MLLIAGRGHSFSILLSVILIVMPIGLLQAEGDDAPADLDVYYGIFIDGDEGFNSTNGVSSGNGTKENPYILQNLTVKVKDRRGIRIDFTEAHFIIRNTTIVPDGEYRGGIDLNFMRNGTIVNCSLGGRISLYRCFNMKISDISPYNGSNGGFSISSCADIHIENTIITNTSTGLGIHSSENCDIINSSITNVGYGTSTEYSDGITFKNITITNATSLGISDKYSSNILVEDIEINSSEDDGGVKFWGSGSVTIDNLTLFGNGFILGDLPENSNWEVKNDVFLNHRTVWIKCNEDLKGARAPIGVPQIILINVSNAVVDRFDDIEFSIEIHRCMNVTVNDLILNDTKIDIVKLFDCVECSMNDVTLQWNFSVIWVRKSEDIFIDNVTVEDDCFGRIELDHNNGIQISNFTVDNNYRFDGIKCEFNDNITFKDSIFNVSYKGLELTGCDHWGNGEAWFLTIDNCSFNFNYYPIHIESYNNIKITNSSVTNPQQESISIQNVWGGEISGNILSDEDSETMYSMILIVDSLNITVSQNKIETGRFSGVGTGYSSNLTIVNNTMMNLGSGVSLGYSDNCTVENNDIYLSTYSGVHLLSSFDCKVSNNSAELCDAGVYSEESQRNIIQGNYLMNNINGIYLKDSSFNTVLDNTMKQNRFGIRTSNTILNDIFNNAFLNMHQYVIESGSDNWEIGKKLGKNIVGGPYLGGNFWIDYEGMDIDGDGLGDTNIPYGPGDSAPLIVIPTNVTITDRTTDHPKTGKRFQLVFEISDNYLWAMDRFEFHYQTFDKDNKSIKGGGQGGEPTSMIIPRYVDVPNHGAWMDYNFTIWDIYGNVANVSWEGPIEDTIYPYITDWTTSNLTTGKDAWIEIEIEENIGVERVIITPWKNNVKLVELETPMTRIDDKDSERWRYDFRMDKDTYRMMFQIAVWDVNGIGETYHSEFYDVYDNIDPRIELKSNISQVFSGERLDMIFQATDNIIVNTVEVRVRTEGIDKILVINERENNLYHCYFNVAHLSSNIILEAKASDPSGNFDEIEFLITPIPIRIEGILVNTGAIPETGSNYTISFQLKDPLNFSVEEMKWWFNHEQMNVSRSKYLNASITVPIFIEIINVRIALMDQRSNSRSFDFILLVKDIIPPDMILVFAPPENGKVLVIDPVEDDNIATEEVGLRIDLGNGLQHLLPTSNGYFQCRIPDDSEYIILIGWVTDSSGLITYDNRTVPVLDRTTPIIWDINATLHRNGDEISISFHVEATDNRELDHLRISLSSSTGWSRKEFLINTHGNEYVQTIPVMDGVRTVYYTIHAEDIYGNYMESQEFSMDVSPRDEEKKGSDLSWHAILILIALAVPSALLVFFLLIRPKKASNSEE